MRTFLTVLAVLLAMASLAQEQPTVALGLLPEDIFRQGVEPAFTMPRAPAVIPIRLIVPEEIVQDSIQLFRFSTNRFAVRWSYTEAGAMKKLAFDEVHRNQAVRFLIGSFESRPARLSFHPMPPTFTNYIQWKEGWLKRRTDKIFVQSEQDAQTIVAGLKNK